MSHCEYEGHVEKRLWAWITEPWSCFSAICTWVQDVGGTLCLHCATYTCKGPSWDSRTAELTHLGSGCCSCLWVLSNAMAQPRMGSFANWTFWHISLGPRGAQKINFLSDFTTGVFTQVLIMPSTEKDQTDAWRQLSSGSIAQNHLNPTTFVQDAVCSAYQSFLWIIFAKKKQTVLINFGWIVSQKDKTN